MTVDRPSGDLGRKLREARQRKGVSLRQIANSTKISVAVLEALERNDVSRLPGGIFGRAFVRSFAIEVGLDPETTIQEFIVQFRDESVSAGHPPSEQIEDHESVESNRRMASAFLRLIALSIPVAGVILYFGVAGRPVPERAASPPAPASEPVAAAPPAADIPAPVPAVAPASASPAADDSVRPPAADEQRPTAVPPAAAPAVPPAAAAGGELTVNLTATRECWVTAVVDGDRQVEQLLEPGDQRTLNVRREVVLTAGDAGALTMTLNGVEARPLGKTGQVVTLRLNPANFKTYLPAR